MRPHPSRRTLLSASVAAALVGCAPTDTASSPEATDGSPRALIYRGPAACDGCSEAVAALVRLAAPHFTVAFCGPDETTGLTAESLASAALYAQPGGGDVEDAWPHLRPMASTLTSWVDDGGAYLGFCLGGYLAGRSPGFDLLPGDAARYIDTEGADITDADDTLVTLTWRGSSRTMYFQDGPWFDLATDADAQVLARYSNALPAAVVAPFGRGAVGVVGPHPEADASWYGQHDLHNPEGVRFDLGIDLVQTTLGAIGS